MADAVTIAIDAVDRTHVIPFRVGANDTSSQIHIEVVQPGIASANMVIWDQTNSIASIPDNAAISVTDPTTPGKLLFNGYVTKRVLNIQANFRLWSLQCVDLNSWLDVKQVGAPDGTAFVQDPPGVFTAYDPNAVTKASDRASVQWLFTKYAPDLPVNTTTYVDIIEPNLPLAALRWNTVSLRQALGELAAMVNSGIRFWIDPDWNFHWTLNPSKTINPGTALGPLVRLFPLASKLPPAPRILTDGVADGVTTFHYEDLSVEWDDMGWADSLYVEGATGYTYDTVHRRVLTGGSGWINSPTRTQSQWGPLGRQQVVQVANADTQAKRNSVGSSLLSNASHSILRGSATVVCNFGGWYPGQGIEVINGLVFDETTMIQRVDTDFLSGAGERLVGIQFGDAPLGTIGLRRNAQSSGGAGSGGGGGGGGGGFGGGGGSFGSSVRPATRLLVTVSNAHPGGGGLVRVYAQVVDAAGNAWPVDGKDVHWSVQVFDSGCVDVTASTPWSLSTFTTQTNIHGMAWVDLTTSSTQNLTYYVTATGDF